MTKRNEPFIATIATAKLSFIVVAAVVRSVVAIAITIAVVYWRYVATTKLMLASRSAIVWTISRQRLPDLEHYASQLIDGPQKRHFSTFWLDC